VDARSPDRYATEAALASADLERIHGLGHARDVVADAIDRVHPGFFAAAAREDATELHRRLAAVAREIWDTHGRVIPARRDRSPRAVDATTRPPVPSINDTDALVGWLRAVEHELDADDVTPPPGLSEELVAIVDRYEDAPPAQREGARLAVARFRLVRHQLSGVAGAQARILMEASEADESAARALRRLLFAESLLDGGIDWRDELLVLRDARRHAERLGLPFDATTRAAAEASSARTAQLLLGVINE